VNTLDELKAHKEKELLQQKTNEARSEYLGKLINAIAEKSKISIPDEIIDEQVASRKKDIENRMKQSGLTLEQYLQFTGSNEEAFTNNMKEQAKKDITNYFILEKVGELEKLDLTDADIEEEYKKLAAQYKMEVKDVKEALKAQFAQFKHNLRMTRIEEKLIESNK
jgi:trigger factor